MSSNADETIKKLYSLLQASQSMKDTEIDFSEEMQKILKKELNNSIKDMVENGELTKMLGLDDTSLFTSSEKEKNQQYEVDEMVANALVSGVQTTSILRNLFGIVPSLIGR